MHMSTDPVKGDITMCISPSVLKEFKWEFIGQYKNDYFTELWFLMLL